MHPALERLGYASLWLLLSFLLASGASAGPGSVCGDGVIEGNEVCDDGNTVAGDGCSFPGCLPEVCGDGIVEPVTEECDDGNTAPGDGCDASCLRECGNSVLDANEECDDGNIEAGDGCDELCLIEICGNGVVQVGEQCDEGAACDDGSPCDINDVAACTGIGTEVCTANAGSATCDGSCASINLDPLDKDAQKCVKAVNQGASKIAKTQNKEGLTCVKDRQKGKIADYDACLVGDTKGKVAKQGDKLASKAAKSCNPANLPPFAYIDDIPAVQMFSIDGPVAVMQALFGDPGDAGIADQNVAKDAAKCQLDVVKRATKLYDTIVKEYVKAKTQGLKGGKAVTAVTSAAELSNLLQNTTVASSKVQKKAEQLNEKPANKCTGVDPAATFPGVCSNADLALVLQCVTQNVACQSCLQINLVDGLTIDCDLVDNDTADASCT